MSKQVTISHLPDCGLCANGTKAEYDARLPLIGRWANVCHMHFIEHDCKLGTGLGQKLVKEDVK